MFLLLNVLISLSLATTTASFSNTESESPCQSPCLACQQTVYNLKFHQKANCKSSHCRNTCWKVAQQWSQPGSVFAAFRNDAVSKCDVCFRAGYCSINECEVQKNYEKAVISQVVDHASLNGVIDNKAMKNLVNKVIKGKTINFKKVAQQVKANISKVTKHVNKKMAKKIKKAIKAVIKAQKPKDIAKFLRKANKRINKAKKSSSGINKEIKSLVNTYQTLLNNAVAQKGGKNRKGKNARRGRKGLSKAVRKDIKSIAKDIRKSINKALVRYTTQYRQLTNIRNKLVASMKAISKNPKKARKLRELTRALKNLDKVLKRVSKSLAKVKKANAVLRKLNKVAKGL